jgi:hypothetical protein
MHIQIAGAEDTVALYDAPYKADIAALPVGIRSGAWKGWVRNMRLTRGGRDQDPVLDTGGATIGYCMGYATSADGQLVAFRSGTP